MQRSVTARKCRSDILSLFPFSWENPKNARTLSVSQMPTENAGKVLQVNGIDLYYETQGSGEPLLLLHGGSGSHEDWVHAGRDDFMREHTLIMPDARGHGRSTNPAKIITHRQCALDTLAL